MRNYSHSAAWLASLVAAVLLAATVASAIAPDPDEPTVEVAGQVVDASGAGVAGAKVQAPIYPETIETKTDQAGKFELRVPTKRSAGMKLVASAGQRMGLGDTPWPYKKGRPIEVRIELGETKPLHVTVTGDRGAPVAEATIGVLVDYTRLEPHKTDEQGVATLLVPEKGECQVVYARKLGQGFDYHVFETVRYPARSPGWPKDGKAQLTLGPTRSVRVRAKGDDGKPISGVGFYPWTVSKPGAVDSFNFGFVPELFQVKTDEEGIAHFDDFPAWKFDRLSFWPSDKRFARRRVTYERATHLDGIVDTTLARFVTLSGQIEFADGSEAPGINVKVNGAGYTDDRFLGTTTSRADGTFEINVAPDEVYLLVVDDPKWAAPPLDGLVVLAGQPVEDLNFTLRRATRVHGRVALEKTDEPIANQYISLGQYAKELNDLPGVKRPDSPDRNWYLRPTLYRSTKTDADGRYEFFVGPGTYTLSGPSQVPRREFVVTNEESLTFYFLPPRAERGMFSGRIVEAESVKPVTRAKISGIYRSQRSGGDLELQADDEGRFRGERQLFAVVLFVRSPDGKLGAVREIGPDNPSAIIKLHPIVKVTGRVLDEATGKPLANRQVASSMRVYLSTDAKEGIFRYYISKENCKTDEEGKFELSGLLVGGKYSISVHTGANQTRMIAELSIDTSETKDLGTVILKKQ